MLALGLDVSPIFGPWLAFRAAMLTVAALPFSEPGPAVSPCDTCEDPPCIQVIEPEADDRRFRSDAWDDGHVFDFINGTCITAGCRMQKSANEIALIQFAMNLDLQSWFPDGK